MEGPLAERLVHTVGALFLSGFGLCAAAFAVVLFDLGPIALLNNLWWLLRWAQGKRRPCPAMLLTALSGGFGLHLLGCSWWWVAILLDPFPYMLLLILWRVWQQRQSGRLSG